MVEREFKERIKSNETNRNMVSICLLDYLFLSKLAHI